MKKGTVAFVVVLLVLAVSAIFYIVSSEKQREELEFNLAAANTKINQLETQSSVPQAEGSVQGIADTSIGKITGNITSSTQRLDNKSLIVCAQNIETQQEYCSDDLMVKTDTSVSYQLEIPTGTYELFVTNIVDNSKSFYTNRIDCTTDVDCDTTTTKQFLEITGEEVQADINLTI